MDDKTKERLKQFLLDYIQVCISHNMYLNIVYSEGILDGELKIIDKEDSDITSYYDFEHHIYSITEVEYLFNIFDELKQSIRKDKS